MTYKFKELEMPKKFEKTNLHRWLAEGILTEDEVRMIEMRSELDAKIDMLKDMENKEDNPYYCISCKDLNYNHDCDSCNGRE